MKKLEKLDDLFGFKPMEEKDMPLELPSKINSSKEEDLEDDYTLARNTMRRVLSQGSATLDVLLDLAKNSETPRTYEVTGQFIKTLSDVSKDLLALQKQTKELTQNSPQTGSIGTQNNIVFAGSTNELMQFLNNKKNDDRVIDQ